MYMYQMFISASAQLTHYPSQLFFIIVTHFFGDVLWSAAFIKQGSYGKLWDSFSFHAKIISVICFYHFVSNTPPGVIN